MTARDFQVLIQPAVNGYVLTVRWIDGRVSTAELPIVLASLEDVIEWLRERYDSQ